jgi:hypothetical protein
VSFDRPSAGENVPGLANPYWLKVPGCLTPAAPESGTLTPNILAMLWSAK